MAGILRNFLAVLAAVIVGSLVNMAIIKLGPLLIPPPPGADLSTPEGLARTIALFEPRHFITPLLAHALGTLVGALVVYRLASTRKARYAYAIGILFLCGGIAACFLIPAPAWFMALDLVVAYLPMAWLAIRISGGMAKSPAA